MKTLTILLLTMALFLSYADQGWSQAFPSTQQRDQQAYQQEMLRQQNLQLQQQQQMQMQQHQYQQEQLRLQRQQMQQQQQQRPLY